MDIVLLDKDCKPKYAYEDDGAMDCFAREDCEWIWEANNTYTCTIPLGFKIDVPRDYVLLLFSRSGMGFKDLTTLVNSVGVIDSGFQNEVKAKLISFKPKTPQPIKKGNKVCQMMLIYRPKIYLDVVDELKNSERGLNGFGSTGV